MAAFEITETDLDEMNEAKQALDELIREARLYAENPDTYTKEEIAAVLKEFLDLFEGAMLAGAQLFEATVEIEKLISPPTQ